MKTLRWEPHDYQKTAVKWLLQHPEAALFLDPGLGKTTITLAALTLLQQKKNAGKALVIAPKRVCFEVWSHAGEIGKWEQFKHLKVALLHGKDKDKVVEEDASLYVINPDGLEWLLTNGHLRGLLKRGLDTLIIDELSGFKHHSTKRVRLLKPLLGRFKRRWGLTGSPASNGLLDLFSQVYMLDMGRALGQFFTKFRVDHFVPDGLYAWKLQTGAEAKIYKRLKPLALSMRAEDHLDLPPLVEQDLWVTLPPAVMTAYRRLEKDLLAQIEEETVTAANAAVASGKCRQVASGGVYVEDASLIGLDEAVLLMAQKIGAAKRRTVHLHNEKTEALQELVDELQGQPLLIAYEFEHDLERIRGALGDVPALNGKTTDAQASSFIKAWNLGELPLLAGHPAAMSHGLNLQGAGNHLCWYSLTWSFEAYDQAVRRLYRQGQKKRVVVHRLLARHTVDEDVASVLRLKKRTQDSVFDALKRRISTSK